MNKAWSIFVRVFGGFELAVGVLFFMTLATWLGTLNQQYEGLFQSQGRYFESWFYVERNLVPYLGIPLPGGMLLMILLMINLVVGGLLRMRKGASTIGILITHCGILLLLLAGVVKFFGSTEGSLLLWPGDQGSSFSSFYYWEVDVLQELDGGKQRRFEIPHEDIVDLHDGKSRRFESGSWPFALVLDRFAQNAEVAMAGGDDSGIPGVSIGSLRLAPGERNPEEELNQAGMRVRVQNASGSTIGESLLWGAMDYPYVFEVEGKKFGVRLQRKRVELPFTVRLDEFHHEVYPNTTRPKVFASDVTVLSRGGETRTAKIEMNQPLRRDGFILFQSSYGPKGAGPNDRKFSVFQVVSNPSDHWPLIACIVIAIGLLLHFGSKLFRWMRAERKRVLHTNAVVATAGGSTND
ncbi:MAG: cytochrome c biogenesis protein ResB [Planctomycetes bacterium]|nr:cytochrome c biogenesis protein ResB [Planctomycetota bacterium]